MKAVELMRRDQNGVISKVARFVLVEDGTIEVVGLAPNGKIVAEDMIKNGIPGPKFTVVKRDEGETFLQLLKEAFRGSRLWATDVIELPEAEARTEK